MSKNAFTLIELVIVVTILAILAAVVIPIWSNLQTNGRNSATRAALGAIRTALMLYRTNEITSGRTDGSGSGAAAGWPIMNQVSAVRCTGYAGPLPHIMENGILPKNPWGVVSTHVLGNDDCASPSSASKGTISLITTGWRYNTNNGQFWANTAENDGTPSVNLENDCATDPTTENCY